jgi:dipeptidyl-peptidase 4
MQTIFLLGVTSLLLIQSSTRADEPMPTAKKDQPLDASFLRLYAETRGFMLGRPVKPKPTPDGKAVLFLRSEAKKPKLSLFEFDVASGKTKELLTPEIVLKGAEEHLSPEEKARRERMRISLGGFTDYQLTEDGKRILLSLSGKLYVFDRETAKAAELATGKGTLLDPKFSRDGLKIAYVLDEDVYVYDLATSKETRVTIGGRSVKTHGLAEFVAQEEMARFSGYWWSPDGKFIAYEEADHDGVETWYVADAAKPGQEPLKQYYPRPGKKNVAVRLGIVPIAGGETVWIEWDHKKYEYLAAVRWDKHGPLTIQVEDRKQQELILLLVDPKTGRTITLLEEKDPAFVKIHPQFPHWRDPHQFLWLSESSTFKDASDKELPTPNGVVCFLDANGKMTASTDIAADSFQSLIGIRSINEHNFILYSYSPIPTQSVVAMIPDTSKFLFPNRPTALLQNGGEQSATIAEDSLSLVITSATLAAMPQSFVYKHPASSEGDAFVQKGVLPSVAVEPAFTPNVVFEQLGVGGPEDFYAAVVRPHGFDPKKTYPVIVDVYGGPHHLTVQQTMRPWLLMQWLADQGFIVVAVDNRGTPSRGRDWERSIYQKFASVPLEDQVRAMWLLGEKHPEMDVNRVGIVGWSFGGYMSALAVLKRPDVFKAAVAGAPVTDWEDYDSHYTERYMGLLPESQKAYDEANLVNMADKLKRPLLLVHGTADDNVYFRHTLKLTDALFRAGKDFEVLPLPSLTHMVPDPIVTERLWTRIAGHFQKNLGKPK